MVINRWPWSQEHLGCLLQTVGGMQTCILPWETLPYILPCYDQVLTYQEQRYLTHFCPPDTDSQWLLIKCWMNLDRIWWQKSCPPPPETIWLLILSVLGLGNVSRNNLSLALALSNYLESDHGFQFLPGVIIITCGIWKQKLNLSSCLLLDLINE